MEIDNNRVTALILAGARPGKDPVAEWTGVPYKVLAQVGGEPMIERVLRAVGEAATVKTRVLCGPSWKILEEYSSPRSPIRSGQIGWEEPQKGPSGSVLAFLKNHPSEIPLLVTTGDHALLTADIIDYFVREARRSNVDVAFGLVAHSLVAKAFPGTKRTVLRFGKERFCTCNLFLFFSPQAIRLVEFWGQLEQDRKHPIRMIRRLGMRMVIRYLLRQLTLSECLRNLGRRLELQIQEVWLPFPQAAIDVDKPEDLLLVRQILTRQPPKS